MVINRKRSSCADIWPIDEKAGNPPEGFSVFRLAGAEEICYNTDPFIL
jgi:hypothetical protein